MIVVIVVVVVVVVVVIVVVVVVAVAAAAAVVVAAAAVKWRVQAGVVALGGREGEESLGGVGAKLSLSYLSLLILIVI